MTVEQALNMVETNRLIISGGTVFFNTWDPEEAEYWSKEGANVRPFYSEQAVKFASRVKPGWEVQPKGACEPITVTKLTGEVEDVTALRLVQLVRERRR